MLLSAYGVCFGFMYKAGFISRGLIALPIAVDDKGNSFFARMLVCPYCTGFHAGWMVWFISDFKPDLEVLPALKAVLLFSMASSAFCYFIDSAIQSMEKN